MEINENTSYKEVSEIMKENIDKIPIVTLEYVNENTKTRTKDINYWIGRVSQSKKSDTSGIQTYNCFALALEGSKSYLQEQGFIKKKTLEIKK